MSHRPHRLSLAGLALAGLTACTAPTHRVHHTLLDEPRRPLPRTVVLLPSDIRMYEISAGGVPEEVHEWSEIATANMTASLDDSRARARHFEVLGMPPLTPDEEEIVHDHLALYDAVAASAMEFTSIAGALSDPLWQHKIDHFDYTIGPGLAFLADRTGADAAVVVVGRCFVPSSGRIGMGVFAALLGQQTTAGWAYAVAGLVDLRTGDLLWLNHDTVASQGTIVATSSFRERSDTDAVIARLTEPYPGLQEFDALRTKAR